MKLIKYPNPILRKKCKKIKNFGRKWLDLGLEMYDFLALTNGIGLAAPQVGLLKQICVIDLSSTNELCEFGYPLIMLNPKFIIPLGLVDNDTTEEEGCLSIPDVRVNVTRPKGITINFKDWMGRDKSFYTEGLLARCIQHEVDHLNGILIIDYK